uniref:Uncharacterized protein n=1 Tax=Ralstonia syzygii R24 TaxID=907261 RepID=G3A952_9RALS|nr:conserved hypothetical protein [Ralstonia syzygii R24]
MAKRRTDDPVCDRPACLQHPSTYSTRQQTGAANPRLTRRERLRNAEPAHPGRRTTGTVRRLGSA